MRIFLAGASGVLGVRLVPLLVADGHTVAGMTRSPLKAGPLQELGAEPVVGDIFEAALLTEAVVAFAPDLVMHQVTDLPDDPADMAAHNEGNRRVRREGTRNLLAAAKAAGASRFLAQSIAWMPPGDGGRAVEDMERMVLQAGGVVLRYGQFYGPGTYFAEAPEPPRIHVDEAARETVAALDAPPGIVTISS